MTKSAQTLRTTQIVAETCPQCGFAETVCETRAATHSPSRFQTCPHCGFAEETCSEGRQRWKGNGVYVVQGMAGAFALPIPDDEVPGLLARFQDLGSGLHYLTRWNERENRLDVLFAGTR